MFSLYALVLFYATSLCSMDNHSHVVVKVQDDFPQVYTFDVSEVEISLSRIRLIRIPFFHSASKKKPCRFKEDLPYDHALASKIVAGEKFYIQVKDTKLGIYRWLAMSAGAQKTSVTDHR